MRKLFIFAVSIISIPIIASCGKQQSANPIEQEAKSQEKAPVEATVDYEKATDENLDKVPPFSQLWALANVIHDHVWDGKKLPDADKDSGLKLLVNDREQDPEEPIEMITILYGKGLNVSKKKMDDYTQLVIDATSEHACYVRFDADTSNGTIIAFKSKKDAETCAEQMKPFLRMEEGVGYIGKSCFTETKPVQDDDGWWIISCYTD